MKRIAAVALATLVWLVAACGDPGADAKDILFLQSSRGVTIVEAGGVAPTFTATPALPASDWETVVKTIRESDGTRVVALDPSSGIEKWSQTVTGRLRVKAVSADGGTVVLEPAGAWYGYSPTMTRFVIVRGDGSEPQTIELEGNFAPEAFSTDAKSLFVVQYFPALNPNRYQVRRLDLASGEVNDVYSVDAELQEAMRGTARIQTMSPDGTRLYTLYSLRQGDTSYAFIHVLSLDEMWAHCVDLPPEFAESPQRATSLTVSEDGTRLYVANVKAGILAEIDTTELSVLRTSEIEADENGDSAYAAYGSDGHIYIASGWEVHEVDVDDLGISRSWKLNYEVTGLQTGEGTKLYVGQDDEIASIDLAAEEGMHDLDPPGIGTIGRLGKVMRGLDPVRAEIVCAC